METSLQQIAGVSKILLVSDCEQVPRLFQSPAECFMPEGQHGEMALSGTRRE